MSEEWTVARIAREAGVSWRTAYAFSEGRSVSGWARRAIGRAAERKMREGNLRRSGEREEG